MCGLFAEFGPATLHDATQLSSIAGTIAHRGPDDDGFAMGKGWMLGFRRLAILDLSPAGHQPMQSQDGRYTLVFNGEIYNYRELKADLEAAGERFASGTDTEVLLRLIIRDGLAKTLPKLNGMFTFCFVDQHSRRFAFARDRLGVKPLYLFATAQGLRIASELKALLAWPGAPRTLNRQVLADFLATGYVAGAECIFQGYTQLPPAHYAEGSLDAPRFEPRQYWSVEIQPGPSGSQRMKTAAEQLDALLSDAVRIRLRSDVPVALLLSGGIDSGLVAAKAAALGTPPMAIVASTGPDDPEGDETELARSTAAHLGLPLVEMRVAPSDLAALDTLATIFDEPFADPSALPMLKICAEARKTATVLLTGDGGDEAFGGYRRYLQAGRYNWLRAFPESLRTTAWTFGRTMLPPKRAYQLAKASLPRDLFGAVFDGIGLARDPLVQAVLPEDLRSMALDVTEIIRSRWGRGAAADLMSRQRAFDYAQYLPEDVLVKVDRASMAASTEVRSPFLDYRIVEFAATLPNDLLATPQQGKRILRDLATKALPPSVFAAPKRGFSVPLNRWLRSPEGIALVRDRLLGYPDESLWNKQGVQQVLNIHVARKRNCGDLLWRLLVLEAWARHYLVPGEASA